MDGTPQDQLLSGSSRQPENLPESQPKELPGLSFPQPYYLNHINGKPTSFPTSYIVPGVPHTGNPTKNFIHTPIPPSFPHPAMADMRGNFTMAGENTRTHGSPGGIKGENAGISQKEPDNSIPESPASGGAYASSSSALSSISTSCMPDPPASFAIPESPGVPIKDLSPFKSGLTLKLNLAPGLRNIAPAVASSSTATAAGPSSNSQSSSPTKSKSINSATNRRKSGGIKRRKSRKAGKYDDDEDGVIKAEDSDSDGESMAPTPVATQTKSGRQIHRPSVFTTPQEEPRTSHTPDTQPPRKKRRVYRKGKEVNVLCCNCDRGHSPAGNVIVFCDECNSAWHQFCHDPPIDKEVVTVKEKEWSCKECRPVELPFASNLSALQMRMNGGINGAASKHQAPLSSSGPWVSDINKVNAPLIGGSGFTTTERHGYLAGLSHSALVNLLIGVSDSRPDIAIFPQNLRSLRSSAFVSSRNTTASTKATSTSSRRSTTEPPTAPIKGKEKAVGQEPILNSQSNSSHLNPTPLQQNGLPNSPSGGPANVEDDDEDDEIEEYRIYPRAGNGFVLPPDSADLDMLLEDPSSTTFSHSLHGSAKAGAEASQLRVVGVA